MQSANGIVSLLGYSARTEKSKAAGFAFRSAAVLLGEFCAVVLFAIAFQQPGTDLQAADLPPGSQHDATFTVTGKTVVLRFRGCPQGELIPGDPRNSSAPVTMAPFYFGETEITFAQIRDILGEEKHKELLDGIKLIDGAGAFAHLLSKPELPAFGVDIFLLRDLCRELNRLSDANSSGDMADIETRRFRPPTHFEWQYAARAVVTAKSKYPHFNSWPPGDQPHKQMSSQVRGKSIELWKALGKTEAEFRGTQDQVVQLCSRVGDAGEIENGLDVLTAYLRLGLGMPREWGLSFVDPPTPLVLVPAGSDRPNNWNIHDMHTSATEWCLHGFQSLGSAATEFWNQVVKDDEVGDVQARRAVLLVVGGGFNRSIYPLENTPLWSCFSVWGGPNQAIGDESGGLLNFDPSSGKVIPFSIKEMEEDIAAHIFEDECPGARLVLVRALNENWLTVVRKDVTGAMPQLEDLHSRFDLRKEKISELVPGSKLASIVAKLEHYRALAVYRGGQLDQAKALLTKLDYGSPQEADGLYFKLVQQAIIGDQKSADAPPEP
jgi:formylglycine-generating enzyme required for sulfatase activity